MAITTAMRTEVSQLYVALFGRAPDGDGLGFWVQLRDQGQTMAQLANTMYATTPARTYFPSFLTNTEIISAFYTNVLGRTADADGLAFWTGKLNAAGATPGSVIAEMISVVANYSGTDAAGVISKDLFNNKVSVAQYYGEKNGTVAGATAVLSGVTNVAATVTTAKTNIDNGTVGGVNQGQNYVLTTGVDNVVGTNGNDTITADNTGGTAQLSVADTINGGSGTDTLKIFLAAAGTATGQPTLSGIETVYINGGAVTAYTAATGTTTLSIDAASANTAATYTLAGQDIVLANKTSTAATTTTIAKAASGTQTAQKITLNGITRDKAGNETTIDVTGTGITTLNLEATGANSNVNLANTTAAAVTTINFAGDKNLTAVESAAMAAAVTTVNASTATGALTLDTSAGTVAGAFKFTGGAGNDTVTFADNALGTLISGAQLDGGAGTDKLGIKDTALTATETGRINQAVNFETLGLNAGITLDASTLTTIKSFSVDAAVTATINSMATASTTTVTVTGATLVLGTNVGVTDTNIVIGGATSAGLTVASLTTTGITSVSLTSNGTAANTVTTLVNTDNSVFNLKGGADLTLALAAGTAVGSKIDGSAATGKLTLTGSNITTSGDIVIGGTAADTLNGGKGADTLTGGAAADTFSFTSTAGANASGGTFGQADVITDFVVGTDKLQFAGVTDVVSVQQGAVQTAVSALAAGSSATAIATAMATANTTNLGVSFAVFGGDTYVLFETTGASTGVAADDVFIKLTGVATAPTFAADVVA